MRRITAQSICFLLVASAALSPCTADVKMYDDYSELAVWGRTAIDGVGEPAVPTWYGGVLQGSFQAVEANDRVPGGGSFPTTVSDLIANTYVRPTYQLANGSTGVMGTSVVSSFSYQTAGGLQYVPAGASAEVVIGGADRLHIVRDGQFGADATARSTCSFTDPPLGSTTVSISTQFTAQQPIALSPGLRGNNALRLMTLSSMYSSSTQYDANAIRWLDPAGIEHVVMLSGTTPRDTLLFAAPMEIAAGGFFELVKTEGSTWNTTSPSMRIDLAGLSGITGRVGIQGWLAPTTDPKDDSLTLWLEWIDAPAVIPTAAQYEADFTATATAPEPLSSLDPYSIVDFLRIQAHFGQFVSGGRSSGDLDRDGRVDVGDLMYLQRNLGVTSAGELAASTAVPEPGAVALLAAVAALLAGRRRNQ